jgi:molybdopterin-binding protein
MGPANLLRLEYVAFHDDHVHGRIGDQMFYVPADGAPTGSPLFVQFLPADVMLAQRDVNGLSVRNHIHGRVCQLVSVHKAVFVAVDVGQVLWAEVTPEAAAELQLSPGMEVTCLLKAYNLRLIA